MSFRNRLTLFFVAIVIVPMVSLAVVLFRLIDDNETGKSDASVAARQEAARNLYAEDVEKAGRLADQLGADPAFARALRAGDRRALARRARELTPELGIIRLRVVSGERELLDAGRPDAVAVATRQVVDPAGGRRFAFELSARSAAVLARRIERVTGLDAVLRVGESTLTSTLRGVPSERLPTIGFTTVGEDELRAASFDAPHFAERRLRLTVLFPQEGPASDVGRARLLAAILLVGFFGVAFVFAIIVSRALQGQVEGLLQAARRLGRGDFTVKVPAEGRDEFAALGQEFNRMAAQLEARLADLQRERSRLETTLRRIGEAFASNLDRVALVELAVRTAVDGVGADGGRVRVLRRGEDEEAVTGDAPDGVGALVADAEQEALSSGQPREASTDGGAALAHPLRGAQGGEVLGVVSVWRRDRPFAPSERELFHYLAGQVGISLENVSLHETVQRQAVTDELTGLNNHRRFQEALASEIERARRFDQELGLVMLDVDDFKAFNDTHGHQVGDQVLRDVARVVRDESREVDAPARYGGEELAVVLPGTDLDGAFQFAERVREGIERLRVATPGGEPLRVTASFGAAALPATATDQPSLIAAADGALYAAKRGGKNRTERAG